MLHVSYNFASRAGLEPKLDKFLDELKVQSFVWAAFGPERGNYFIAWLRLDGKLSFCRSPAKQTPNHRNLAYCKSDRHRERYPQIVSGMVK